MELKFLAWTQGRKPAQVQEDFVRNKSGFETDVNSASTLEQEVVVRMCLCVGTCP